MTETGTSTDIKENVSNNIIRRLVRESETGRRG